MISPEVHARAEEALRRVLADGLRLLQSGRNATVVGVTIPIPTLDPLAIFRCGEGHERFFWERATDGVAFVAIGSVATLTSHGERRFEHIAQSWRSLLADAVVETAAAYPFTAPVCLGGFAFDGGRRRDPEWRSYGDALLVLPRVLFTWSGASCWLSLNARVSTETPEKHAVGHTRTRSGVQSTYGWAKRLFESLDHLGGSRDQGMLPRHGHRISTADCRSPAVPAEPRGGDSAFMAGVLASGHEDDDRVRQWKRAVSAIAADARRGHIEKQVLARRVRFQSLAEVDPAPVLESLRTRYGAGCTVFAISRADTCFVGASPERLVRAHRGLVRADAVAGSAPRGGGSLDDALGVILRDDRKERHEHDVVVRAIRDALAPRCSSLTVSPEPALLRMPNVQHLHSVVEGVLRERADIFELVACLHPTPACGGTPRDGILRRIRYQEAFDRGWYAGPVGWVDRAGNGDFAVAIRSALLRQIHNGSTPAAEAILYAGCGIVAGSDPDQEYRESSLKLRPLLEAIGTHWHETDRRIRPTAPWRGRQSV